MKITANFLLIVLYTMLFSNCCKGEFQSESSYIVEKKDGIETIHNFSTKNKNKIKLKLHLKFGGIDTEDDNYMFGQINDIRVDQKGNYYVADTKRIHVFVYDSTGKFIRKIGRKGQGPGEFLSPTKIFLDNNENLIVCDITRTLIIPLNKKGTDGIKKLDIPRVTPDLIPTKGGNFIIANYSFNMNDAEDATKFRVEILDSKFKRIKGVLRYNRCLIREKRADIHEIFTEQNYIKIAIDNNDDIFTAGEVENIFYKFSKDGKMLKKFDRELPYKTKPILGNGWCHFYYNPTANFIGVDNKGRLWVELPNRIYNEEFMKSLFGNAALAKIPKPPHILEIYDNEGHLLGINKELENDMLQLRCIAGDKLIFRDSDRITVYVYKIVEN